MEPILFRYRGRDLSAEDIAFIRGSIVARYARGRSFAEPRGMVSPLALVPTSTNPEG